jgi:PAS domain S-box-containing protein
MGEHSISRPELSRKQQAKAWLPLPLLIFFMAVLWALDLHQVFPAPRLLLILNLLFSTVVSLVIAYLLGRSFLLRGEPWMLLIASGVLLWGLVSVVAVSWGFGNPNIKVSIYNVGVWCAAMLHWVGAVAATRRHAVRWPAWWWGVSVAATVLLLVAIISLVSQSWWPVFFVAGEGGTPIRQAVLGSAIGLFGATGWRLWQGQQRSGLGFLHWYGVGLGLLGAGLAGVLLDRVFDGVLMWTGRFTQYLGGVYMLVAAITVVRTSGALRISGVELLASADSQGQADLKARPRLRFLLRYGGAVAGVGLGYGLRLLVEWSSDGMLPPYVTFFPLVILVALLAGLGPGLLATGLTMFLVTTEVLEPTGQPSILTLADRIGLILFAGTSIVISVIAEVLRRVRRVAAAQQRALALHASEERYRVFIETTSQGVVRAGRDGTVEYVNPPMAQLVGTAAGSLLGRAVFDFVFPEDAAHALDLFQRALAGEKLNIEIRLRRQDGTPIWTAISASPLRDQNGQITGVLGMIADITAGKQAEEQSRQHLASVELLNKELAVFNRMMVGRELRMIELKEEINQLCRQAGLPERYRVDFPEAGKLE